LRLDCKNNDAPPFYLATTEIHQKTIQTSEKSEKPHKPLQALTFPFSENQIFRKFSDIFRSDFAKIYQNFRQTNSSQRQLTQASV
jgi:hypothetical protein